MTPEHRRVEALLALGRNDEAVALMAKLPARDTPDVEFLRLRGRALRAAGRVFDAEASFREALSVSPHEAGILADLSTTLVGQRRHRDALPYAREAVALRPEVAAYQALLGFVAESLELSEEARRALTQARELAPSDAEAHTVFGYHALRTGLLDEAQAAFGAALGADPRRAEPVRGLARVALARGDWELARTRWIEALRADPKQRDARLQPMLFFGHPALRPVRAVTTIPVGVSVGLAAGGGALLLFSPAAASAQFLSITLLACAAAGPLARRALAGGSVE